MSVNFSQGVLFLDRVAKQKKYIATFNIAHFIKPYRDPVN